VDDINWEETEQEALKRTYLDAIPYLIKTTGYREPVVIHWVKLLALAYPNSVLGLTEPNSEEDPKQGSS
jgi:hypothetical protein